MMDDIIGMYEDIPDGALIIVILYARFIAWWFYFNLLDKKDMPNL